MCSECQKKLLIQLNKVIVNGGENPAGTYMLPLVTKGLNFHAGIILLSILLFQISSLICDIFYSHSDGRCRRGFNNISQKQLLLIHLYTKICISQKVSRCVNGA